MQQLNSVKILPILRHISLEEKSISIKKTFYCHIDEITLKFWLGTRKLTTDTRVMFRQQSYYHLENSI